MNGNEPIFTAYRLFVAAVQGTALYYGIKNDKWYKWYGGIGLAINVGGAAWLYDQQQKNKGMISS